MLHALQILIENAIGKAKQLLKASNQPVPVSDYDAFKALANSGQITPTDLPAWNAIIGLRNRIVHDYMDIDMAQVTALVVANKDQFVVRFLCNDLSKINACQPNRLRIEPDPSLRAQRGNPFQRDLLGLLA